MSTPRLRPGDAREILAGIGNPCGNRDFHTLRQAQVEALLAEADKLAYRQPRNANGSRARYFHAWLVRVSNREE